MALMRLGFYNLNKLLENSRSKSENTVSMSLKSVESKEFTQALSLAASGVNIVTTDGPGGKAGLTVSSMCSVCATPPVVLACVASENEFCAAAASNGTLVINLLTSAQEDIAMVFAGQTDQPKMDRFLTGNWSTLSTGSPVLQNALVSLDCEIAAVHEHGTHRLYISRVVALQSNDDAALIYCRRKFGKTLLLFYVRAIW